MAGIFDALKQIPKREPKKFFVKVEGKDYEDLIIKNGEITVKPPAKLKTQHKTLIKAEKGYVFQDNDIHWPNGIAEGGVTWQIERE